MRFCSTLAFIVIVSVQTYSITAFACTPNTDTPLGDHLPYYPVYAGNTFPSNFRLISAGVYESFFEDPGEWEKESTSGQIEQIQFEVDEDFSYGSDSFEGQLRGYFKTGLAESEKLLPSDAESGDLMKRVPS